MRNTTQEAPYLDVDFASAQVKRNPFPLYQRLRDEMPVTRFRPRGPAGGGPEAFAIARYADVSALAKDRRFTKDRVNAGLAPMRVPGFMQPLTRNMLALDDPDHARLKRLVQAAFTPRRIAMMQTSTQALSARLLDGLPQRASFDVIADYAMPLPVAVISELLGVPAVDQSKFGRWSGALIRAGRSHVSTVLALPDVLRFLSYLKRFISMKRKDPKDDLVSALVAAEADGEKLDAEELMAMIGILLSAGHETTVNLLGNGLLALLTHPEAMAKLRAQPEIIDTAVEELLRFCGPIASLTHRYAMEDLEISGVQIPKGSLVFGLVASANRDERQFANADTLDLARTPNRHLSFGEGGHYCIGASLARMEGAIGFRDILARFPNLKIVDHPDQLRWTPGLVLRGLQRLKVAA